MHTVIKLTKKQGKLNAQTEKLRKQFEVFLQALNEGDVVEAYFEVVTDDGTLGQLSLLHMYIRQLAMHTGNTFEGMKFDIKRLAGLFLLVQHKGREVMHVKSFGDESKESLSLAIQACIELGEELDYKLN